VTVEVASASRYDELLAQSGLNDAGESDGPSVAFIATSSIGGGDAKAEDGSRRRRLAFVAIVVSLAVGLLIVGVIGSRRSRRQSALSRKAEERHAERMREAEERRKERASQHAAAVKAHEESVARAAELATGTPATKLVCPSCRREYPPGSAFCPNDANRLIPLPGHEEMLGGGPLGGICPTCKRGFDPGVKTCPHDGEELVPYALYASRMPSQPPLATRGKICPTCGDRFEGAAAFCGKDGTALVLLN
jgi:rubrerythrin